jgi:hypothetical protein
MHTLMLIALAALVLSKVSFGCQVKDISEVATDNRNYHASRSPAEFAPATRGEL